MMKIVKQMKEKKTKSLLNLTEPYLLQRNKKTEDTSTIDDFKITSNIPVSNRFSVLDNYDIEDTTNTNTRNSSTPR